MKELRAGLDLTPMLQLLRPLGEGGMGKVWVARHKGLETDVVVKFLSVDGPDQKDAEARFAREASAAAAVKSPHVAQVFDHGTTADGLRYIVMELLDGHDLAAHLAAHGPMSPRDVAAVVAQAAKALSKAHQVGVIHRDVKPENIFLCDGDGGEMFVKVLDFGIAKRTEEVSAKTTTGQVVGTPFYMSPEQILGEPPVDARTDIWALGVVAFEALTGRRPFEGTTVGAITLAIHRSSARPTALVPALPPAIDDWFARACARDPNERFATAREAAQALLIATGEEISSSPQFRAPSFSLADASDASLGARLEEHAGSATSLSSSFRAPASRRTPSPILLGGAFAVVLLLTALVVVALVRGRGTSRDSSSGSAALGATSGVAGEVATPSVSVPVVGPSAGVEPSALVATPPAEAVPSSAVRTRPATIPGRGATGAKSVKPPPRRPSDDDIK